VWEYSAKKSGLPGFCLQGNQAGPEWFSAILDHDLKEDARERFLRMHAYEINTPFKIWPASNFTLAGIRTRQLACIKLLSMCDLKGVFISN
jgi:molybdopterin molybdotransferase